MGISPPTPDWGLMVAEGVGQLTYAPWPVPARRIKPLPPRSVVDHQPHADRAIGVVAIHSQQCRTLRVIARKLHAPAALAKRIYLALIVFLKTRHACIIDPALQPITQSRPEKRSVGKEGGRKVRSW